MVSILPQTVGLCWDCVTQLGPSFELQFLEELVKVPVLLYFFGFDLLYCIGSSENCVTLVAQSFPFRSWWCCVMLGVWFAPGQPCKF